ncbi:GNAT family N-acetyltransferase [Catenuloplanes indicus]|uniref:GNAT superfamily N-acetyltransferase n=1 Tax=Catenuloplanes indicus TaxID=137267 RepID=A0AAE3VTZ6_9ACTN|nr:GNAT family N-acetyltransferase [Catenuloplanes indicus]MDQ0363642.1 GNAT superfamily N-acetyltransferase [Catenuloplanes indicus]
MSLIELHEAAGCAPVTWGPDRTRDWWRAWTASARGSGAEFRVLARDATGGCVALWLIDANPPVVYLGADGEAAVLASDVDDYAALLASGVTPAVAAAQAGLPGVRAAQARYPEFPALAWQPEPVAAIRLATADDAEDLTDLITTSMGYAVAAHDVAERLRGLPEDGNVVYVAVTDRVAGWVHVMITHGLIAGTRAELGGLAVAQPGSGSGSALLAAAERWAVRHGVTSMYIRSGTERTEAHGFYARRGYTVRKTQLALTKTLA